MTWAGIALIMGATSVLMAHPSHYTWWVLLQFFVYAVLQTRDLGHRFVWAFLAQCFMVIASCWYMSIAQCTMLSDTKDEYGDAPYGVLNFAAHYAPSVLTVLLPPPRAAVHPRTQVQVGIGLYVCFASIMPPSHQYGCSASEDIALLGVVAVGCAIWALAPALDRWAFTCETVHDHTR